MFEPPDWRTGFCSALLAAALELRCLPAAGGSCTLPLPLEASLGRRRR